MLQKVIEIFTPPHVIHSRVLRLQTALTFAALWFIFFLAIELFVLVSKYGDTENDYDKVIQHQKDVRIRALDALISD